MQTIGGGGRVVLIRHPGQGYRLPHARNHKLILVK